MLWLTFNFCYYLEKKFNENYYFLLAVIIGKDPTRYHWRPEPEEIISLSL